jgi:hypothetical protein
LQQSFPCPKCGVQIQVGQKFCGTCGQRFEYRCHHCGNAVADSSGFCSSCGGKLSHQTQHTAHKASRAENIHYGKVARVDDTVQHPAGQIGRYFVVVAIIFIMIGIIYFVGTSSQGASSNLLGGFSFGGQSPPSTPPATNPSVTNSTAGQVKSEFVSDSPSMTTDQVIAAANKFSPACRLQTKRTS